MPFALGIRHLLLVVLLGGPWSPATANRITTELGIGADSYVAKYDSTASFGADSSFLIKNAAPLPDGPDFDRKAYIRFDFSGILPHPEGDTVQLILVVSGDGDGTPVVGPQAFSVYGLSDGDTGESWQESSLTWTNAPANDGSSGNGVLSNAALVGHFTLDGVGSPGTVVRVFSSELSAFVESDTNGLVTFIIVRDQFDPDAAGWYHAFVAKEHPTEAPPALLFLDGITTAVGSGADAYAAKYSPSENFGLEPTLQVKNAAPLPGGEDFDRKSYFRFDLSQATAKHGDAQLILTVGDDNQGQPVQGAQTFSVYGLSDGDSGETWDESLITWNNAPANDLATGDGVLPNATLLGQFVLDGTGTTGATVTVQTSELSAFLDQDTNDAVTFIIVRNTHSSIAGSWIHNFASREHPALDPPQLLLPTVTAAPGDGPVVMKPRVAVSPGRPSPSRGPVRWVIDNPAREPLALSVFAIDGRLVARLPTPPTATRVFASWDGVDWHGRRVGSGAYFLGIRRSSGHLLGVGKAVIVR